MTDTEHNGPKENILILPLSKNCMPCFIYVQCAVVQSLLLFQQSHDNLA